MAAHFKKITDDIFWRGIEEGDILWFIDRNIKKLTTSCSHFGISLTLIAFCSMELAGQLLMLTRKPSVWQIINFAPMFIASLGVLFMAGPLIIQQSSYNQLYRDYLDLWPLKSADAQGLLEIRELFGKCLFALLFYGVMVCAGGTGYLPLTGLDYDRSVFPAIAVLKLVESGPKVLVYSIIAINFILLFAKGYFLALYGMHIMHMCTIYTVQNILLRRRLTNIQNYDGPVSSLLELVDDAKYQSWVQRELKECIKLDIKLKKFSRTLIGYFKWAILAHVGICISVLSLLYYINFFMSGGYSPMGSITFAIGANAMAVVYAHYSETFHEQVGNNRNALYETPWHTFNISNRKLVLLFLSNLTRSQYITAGGVFDVNYSLLIFVMHKVFNFLTVLSKLSPPDGI